MTYTVTAMMTAKASICIQQLLSRPPAMLYPASSELASASTQSMAKITSGGWIWVATLRVVVMSIIAFNDGSNSIVVAWGPSWQAASAWLQICPWNWLAQAKAPARLQED